MISEMIHTASLVHDDVVDASETRRGKKSVQTSWGQKNVRFSSLQILLIHLTPTWAFCVIADEIQINLYFLQL